LARNNTSLPYLNQLIEKKMVRRFALECLESPENISVPVSQFARGFRRSKLSSISQAGRPEKLAQQKKSSGAACD
jgi:hypothetical protein